MEVYVKPATSTGIIVPLHDCSGSFSISPLIPPTPFERVYVARPEDFTQWWESSRFPVDVSIKKAGPLRIRATGSVKINRSKVYEMIRSKNEASVRLELLPVRANGPLLIEHSLEVRLAHDYDTISRFL